MSPNNKLHKFNLFAAQTKLSDLPVACTKTLAQKKEKFVFNFKDGKVKSVNLSIPGEYCVYLEKVCSAYLEKVKYTWRRCVV